ncbi:hypothetical protein VNO80_01769 [Phaseolus coccineus]|uniref:Uncharacterized protein n=1 Tax=Phaseolus coccineus TaxID=3886 RepID=A0AAN9RT59_PHACN
MVKVGCCYQVLCFADVKDVDGMLKKPKPNFECMVSDRHDAALVKQIVSRVLELLDYEDLSITQYPVGLDSRVEKVIGWDRSYPEIVPETAFDQQRLLQSSCFQGNEEIKTATTGSCTTYWRLWV